MQLTEIFIVLITHEILCLYAFAYLFYTGVYKPWWTRDLHWYDFPAHLKEDLRFCGVYVDTISQLYCGSLWFSLCAFAVILANLHLWGYSDIKFMAFMLAAPTLIAQAHQEGLFRIIALVILFFLALITWVLLSAIILIGQYAIPLFIFSLVVRHFT